MFLRFSLIFVIFFTLSCSKKEEIIYNPSTNKDPYKLYKEGLEAFDQNNFFFANKKFSEAELNFKVIELAAKSAIMSSFSLYGINFYNEAEENLKRFLKIYPSDKHVLYANYLLAIIYYEQIDDEKKDLQPLLKADKQIKFFLQTYPDSEYASDLKFKLDLIQNQLAAKEVYVAKYYIKTQKWIPAINRLKTIVEDYSETIFIEEALHRLVEVYYKVGLENEANSAAALLGYNYNSSEWYEQSYKLLNKQYKIKKKSEEKKNNGLIMRTIKKIL